MKHLAEKQLTDMNYGKDEKALFYLGALARSIDGAEEKKLKRRIFCDRIYIRSEFEENIQKLYNQTMEKIVQYDLEAEMTWAMKGFVENYSAEVEKMPAEEKRFYLISGTAFYGSAPVFMEPVMSVKEIAELWELDTSTLRKAIARGEFKEGEYRKSGGTWLIKKSAMYRVYGEPKKKEEK